MVRRGEYLERAVVIPGGDHPIEGLYHHGKARPGLLIAPPHPERGGSMEGTIVAELAWAVTRSGHPTLRFNYPGVGASGGVFDPNVCANAAATAGQHLSLCCDPDRDDMPVAVAGIGFGATQVAKLFTEHRQSITHMFLISPEGLVDGLDAFDGELVIVRAQKDTSDRAPYQALVDTVRDGRMTVIPGADPAFHRGLVELGRTLSETLHPPGMIDLS